MDEEGSADLVPLRKNNLTEKDAGYVHEKHVAARTFSKH